MKCTRFNISSFTLFAFLLFTLFTVLSGVANARTYTEPKFEEKPYEWVKNEDGTWTEWYYEGKEKTPLQGHTYSATNYQKLQTIMGEAEVEEGTTGQSPDIVEGSNTPSVETSEEVVEDFRTEKYFQTEGEAEVGNELIVDGEGSSTLPPPETVLTDMGDIEPIGAAFAVGVAIGTGIDEYFGWPSFESVLYEFLGGQEFHYAGDQVTGYSFYLKREGEANYCDDLLSAGGHYGTLIGIPANEGEICLTAWEMQGTSRLAVNGKESEFWYEQLTDCVGPTNCFNHGSGVYAGTYYPPTGGTAIGPENFTVPSGELAGDTFFYQHYNGAAYCEAEAGVEKGNFSMCAFPQKLGEDGPEVNETKGEVTAQAPVAVPKPRPAHVQSPLKTFIAPHGEKHHTVEPEPTQPGEPNPHELPNPVWPVVPNYAPNELGTLYKTQVESVGFTDVEITTVPEIDIDTSVGPDDVVTVVPSVGTAADPSTKVDIAVNPADAPVPEGKKSVLSGPTEPGFKFPDFGVLCKGFPFGVPCWLAKTVESWSVTGKAPELGTEEIEIDHRKIPPGLFDLSHLEPEMEIIRPAMVIFATIGLVLLFYKFAKGGSAPSGSNSDSSGEGGDS